jgi:hypothetical protein
VAGCTSGVTRIRTGAAVGAGSVGGGSVGLGRLGATGAGDDAPGGGPTGGALRGTPEGGGLVGGPLIGVTPGGGAAGGALRGAAESGGLAGGPLGGALRGGPDGGGELGGALRGGLEVGADPGGALNAGLPGALAGPIGLGPGAPSGAEPAGIAGRGAIPGGGVDPPVPLPGGAMASFFGTPIAVTCWTSAMNPPRRAGSAGSAGSGTTGDGTGVAGGVTFSPVHSRNAPHEPQNASASELLKPHFLQTIIDRRSTSRR